MCTPVFWKYRKRQAMTKPDNPNKASTGDIHPYLEETLIESYLKDKGYDLKKLKDLPEIEVKQLMTEASTYASNKLAEVELRAHFVEELHEAHLED
jgi:hypothetical protein